MKRGTPRHKKTRKLAELLSIPLAHAVGILEMLWHWTGQETPQGDIGTASDREIAAAVDWTKRPVLLVDALVSAGWLDVDAEYRLIVHDWPDHADQAVRKWLQRKGKDFLESYRNKSVQCPDKVQTESGTHAQARAGLAGLGSDLPSVGEKESEKKGVEMRREFDEQWQEFERIGSTVFPAGPKDWDKAWGIQWRYLDGEQRTAALDGLRARVGCNDDPIYKSQPVNWLEGRKWQRPVQHASNGREHPADAALKRVAARFLRDEPESLPMLEGGKR